MGVMNRAAFRRQLQLGLNTVFGLEHKRYPEEWRDIFDVSQSKKAYEEDVLLVGFGGAQVKPEGQGVSYDEGAEAWVARYKHDTIALAFAITEEAVEDGLYGDLGAKYARALARSIAHTTEVNGAAVLNNGFMAGAFAGGDGVALFSTAHPLQGGGTLSNTLSTPANLAEASLEDALIQVGGFVDDRGIPVAYQVLKMIIPKDLGFVAQRLLMSPLRPGTPDNDINAMKSMGMVPQGAAINHRLVDPNAWFLKTDGPDGLKYFNRKSLQRGMEGDFETGNMRYKARKRESFGFTDPRGAFGSPGG